MPRASPPPSPPPPPEDRAAAEEAAAATSAANAMTEAAAKLISEMFTIAAQRMEEETRLAKIPPDGPVQKYTIAMMAQLQAQLNRALGLTPKDGVPPS